MAVADAARRGKTPQRSLEIEDEARIDGRERREKFVPSRKVRRTSFEDAGAASARKIVALEGPFVAS